MGLVASVVGAGKGISSVAGDVNNSVQNGVGTGQAQTNINPYLAQQTQLATQLQGVATGTGPNPALDQLNQTTGQNAQQAAGQVASNRGLNAGTAARLGGQDVAQANQQAVGQAATLSAQQQLGALGQLNNVYSSQEGATNTASQTAAGIGSGNQQQTGKLVGGVAGGAGAALGLADGGVVQPINAFATIPAQGPQVGGAPAAPAAQPAPSSSGDGPQSNAGKALAANGEDSGGASVAGGISSLMQNGVGAGMMARGGPVKQVQTILSPGEKTLTPGEAQKVAAGKANPMKVGKTIPGKAMVPGDSLKNDKVPRKLEEGGIVIPRSVMMAKNPHWGAKKFVEAHLGMQSKNKKAK